MENIKEIIFEHDDNPMDGYDAVIGVLESLGVEYEEFEPDEESLGVRYKVPVKS